MQNKIPVPLAIKMLIQEHRDRVNQSLNNLTEANLEFMRMLNLQPEDGWKLDIDSLHYVQMDKQDDNTPVE
jgi:hypothetical protein